MSLIFFKIAYCNTKYLRENALEIGFGYRTKSICIHLGYLVLYRSHDVYNLILL